MAAKGNGELFSHFGFVSLAKKRVLLGKASPASPGASAHHGSPQSWKPALRFARIFQTLFNRKPCLMSDLSQKTPHSNIIYMEKKKQNENQLVCQQKMLHLRQRLRNSAQSHPYSRCALRDESPPSSGPACAEVGARWAIFILISGLKNPITLTTAGSNTAGLSSETPGWVSPTLDQETHSQHFSASDLPLISELPSSPASARAMGQGRPRWPTQERQQSWITDGSDPPILFIRN